MLNNIKYHLPSSEQVSVENSPSNFTKALNHNSKSNLDILPHNRSSKLSTAYISKRTGDITSLISFKALEEKEILIMTSNGLGPHLQELGTGLVSIDHRSNMKNFISARQSLQPTSSRRTSSNVSERDPELDIFSINVPQNSSKSLNKIDKFLASAKWNIAIVFMTFYVLFIDDIRALTINPAYDLEIDVSLFLCIGVFIIEILLNMLVNVEYRWNFFFWIDVISTLTILLDTQYFTNLVFTGLANSAQIARGSRISRIGVKYD